MQRFIKRKVPVSPLDLSCTCAQPLLPPLQTPGDRPRPAWPACPQQLPGVSPALCPCGSAQQRPPPMCPTSCQEGPAQASDVADAGPAHRGYREGMASSWPPRPRERAPSSHRPRLPPRGMRLGQKGEKITLIRGRTSSRNSPRMGSYLWITTGLLANSWGPRQPQL